MVRITIDIDGDGNAVSPSSTTTTAPTAQNVVGPARLSQIDVDEIIDAGAAPSNGADDSEVIVPAGDEVTTEVADAADAGAAPD